MYRHRMYGYNMDPGEAAEILGDFLNTVEITRSIETRIQPSGTKYEVLCGKDQVFLIEILDPETGKALLSNNTDLSQPTEGYFEGTMITEHPQEGKSSRYLHAIGQFRYLGVLSYKIQDREYFADPIHDVKVMLPTGTEFRPWRE